MPPKSNKKIQNNLKKSTLFKIFMENIYSLNNSKFFAGFVMLIMNLGSKYISLELSTSQEMYLKYSLGRQLLIFAILWMGTRDIVISLILTCVFIIFADYLLNENSKFCMIPEKYKELQHLIDEDGDGKISKEEIDKAIKILKKAQLSKMNNQKTSNLDEKFVRKTLVRENFM
jgi:hypothetical protein